MLFMGLFFPTPPPTSGQSVAVPAATDWMAVSKIVAIEIVFVGSSAVVVLGHGGQGALELAWATGAALGVLRITDILANVVNVKSFLSKPASGVVPQAAGTPLVTLPTPAATNGAANASPPTP